MEKIVAHMKPEIHADSKEHNPLGRITVDRVSKIYVQEGSDVVALWECDAEIRPGELVMLIGPSGCGKTTLLNAIAGFSGISGGEIRLDGELIASPKTMMLPGSDRIVVFQNGALFPWKTVMANLVYGPVVRGRLSAREAAEVAGDILNRLGIEPGIAKMYPADLSSGLKRQVEIVRALINDPKVLLLDEPFRALDSISKGLMHQYLLSVHQMSGKTILFITHDLDEAIFLADRVLIMTTRPGTIKMEIKVDIPRPGDFRHRATAQFSRLRKQAWEAIREETLKAFEAGEREMA
jgi:NitT/TauT family transport system ATP-binding protein